MHGSAFIIHSRGVSYMGLNNTKDLIPPTPACDCCFDVCVAQFATSLTLTMSSFGLPVAWFGGGEFFNAGEFTISGPFDPLVHLTPAIFKLTPMHALPTYSHEPLFLWACQFCSEVLQLSIGAHGWVARICQPWEQSYLGAGCQ